MPKNEIQKPEKEVVKTAIRQLVASEIDSQIATAKDFPRDIGEFKGKLMAMANLDQETAEGCFYSLPRGGKAIDGPSIRLAEIAMACYQNVIAEANVTNEDDSFIYATGQCRDLENNVAVRVTVRRRIKDKKGRRFNDDMIAVTANAACAIALRNAIFKIVPGAYIKPVFDQVKKTAVGKATSLIKRRAEVIKRLTKFGVTEERIFKVIGRKSIEEVTFDDVAKLIGLGTAIKDGDTTVEEAFPVGFKESKKEAEKDTKEQAGSEAVDTEFEPEKVQKPEPQEPVKKESGGLKEFICPECWRTYRYGEEEGKGVSCECGKGTIQQAHYVCKDGHKFHEPKVKGDGTQQCPRCLTQQGIEKVVH